MPQDSGSDESMTQDSRSDESTPQDSGSDEGKANRYPHPNPDYAYYYVYDPPSDYYLNYNQYPTYQTLYNNLLQTFANNNGNRFYFNSGGSSETEESTERMINMMTAKEDNEGERNSMEMDDENEDCSGEDGEGCRDRPMFGMVMRHRK